MASLFPGRLALPEDCDRVQRSGQRLIVAAALFYGVAAVPVTVLALVFPSRFGFSFLPATPAQAAIHVAAGLLAASLLVVLSFVLVRRTLAGMRLAQAQGSAVSGLSLAGSILVALLAGVVEEMFFRGALWTLAASLTGELPALAITSILFGTVHGAFRRGAVLWSLTATAAGFVAGLLLMWSDALLAPVVMHVVVDVVDIQLLKKMFRTSVGE